MNTMQIFDSLKAEPLYNEILMEASHLCLFHHIDLHVLHISGTKNIVANALSRHLFQFLADELPYLTISTFQPLLAMPGAHAL